MLQDQMVNLTGTYKQMKNFGSSRIAVCSYILLPGRKMAEDFVGHFEALCKINFDLSDCDKVLRIEGDNIEALRAMIL